MILIRNMKALIIFLWLAMVSLLISKVFTQQQYTDKDSPEDTFSSALNGERTN